MGFLDSLLRKSSNAVTSAAARAVGDVVGDVVEDAAHGFIKGLKNAGEGAKEKASATSAKTKPAKDTFADKEVDDKLREILADEFSQYEVKEQVSPTTIGGEGKFLPYDFAVYENGQPKLFIMVVYNNTCASREYRWSKEQAEQAGVTMINFVYAFENKKDYMVDRLHQYL
ncbi:MAG: hypothetical protein IJ429_00385 [Lachnospiraceae bacterium]|nr:hypothetical protein [Lachnospiraceae bacterium]